MKNFFQYVGIGYKDYKNLTVKVQNKRLFLLCTFILYSDIIKERKSLFNVNL